MPRQARLDAVGTLHHVIFHGIKKRRIVDDDQDRREFVSRLGRIAVERVPIPDSCFAFVEGRNLLPTQADEAAQSRV